MFYTLFPLCSFVTSFVSFVVNLITFFTTKDTKGFTKEHEGYYFKFTFSALLKRFLTLASTT